MQQSEYYQQIHFEEWKNKQTINNYGFKIYLIENVIKQVPYKDKFQTDNLTGFTYIRL